MSQETALDIWLAMSHALFFALIPQETKAIVLAPRSAAEHAFLIHREALRIDSALVDMALAAGEAECRSIMEALAQDTVIALACRWGSYTQQWRETATAQDNQPWQPPNQRDLWRAVLLAMVSDQGAQRAAVEHLGWADWPGFQG